MRSGVVALAPAAALHEHYVAFIGQAKIGWSVVVSLLVLILFQAHVLRIPNLALWILVFGIPVLPCMFVERGILKTILWGSITSKHVLPVLAATALSSASLVVLLASPGALVPVWGWWLSPLVAACAAIVVNAWAQTRGDQARGLGYLSAYIAGESFFGRAGHAALGAYLIVGIAPFSAAWVRAKTGSLFACFAIYLCAEELLWVAYHLGVGHR